MALVGVMLQSSGIASTFPSSFAFSERSVVHDSYSALVGLGPDESLTCSSQDLAVEYESWTRRF